MGTDARERLSSRLGFLLLAAGCAVGLGNVWRFPYVVGQNGGAAFVLVYLLFLLLLGFPVLLAELSVGRGAQKGIVGAFRALAPARFSRTWGRVGAVLYLGCLILMIYYTDVAGWLLKYTADFARGVPAADDPAQTFTALLANKPVCAAYMASAVAIATATCLGGVVKGVERVTKVLMTALLLLLVVLAAKALLLPGADAGVRFYLAPDWGKFMANPARAVFEAMGQAFFTLSIGIGSMTIFGSYLGKERSLVKETAWIIAIDTFVALLAGLVVFPACAAYHVDPTSGPGLIFIALPKVFAQMPGGRVWGFAFFLFLSFAALTTVIAVFECLIGGLVDEWRRPRAAMTLLTGGVVAVLALPCVLFDKVLGWEDFAVSQLWLPLGGLALCLFATRSCGWGFDAFRKEASAGVGGELPGFFRGYMRWALPFVLLAVLVGGFL